MSNKKISAAPSWLGLSDDREQFIFLPERAQIVKRIFELAIGGLGSYAIANYLDERKVPTFTSSETWDHTSIDYMLRNRATYGEYQPKSFASGHKKGIPNGGPISDYYPAAIDRKTFEAAQLARKNNFANRGRKGSNFANMFAGLTKCAYCGADLVFHRVANVQTLVCDQVLNGNGCSRTAWTYDDFEKTILSFLAHPAVLETAREPKAKLGELSKRIADLPTSQEIYAVRVDISVLLKEVISEIVVYCAGIITNPRLPSASIAKNVAGRFLEIRLLNGPLEKCICLS